MDHSRNLVGIVTTLDCSSETNLATQRGLDVPMAPVRIRENKLMGLYSLDIRCLLQTQSNNANRWDILIHPVQAQLKRLPLSRQPNPAGLASTQRPPVLASLLLSSEQVNEPHGHVTDNWILQEVPVVNDLDCDSGSLFIGAQELGGRLPHGAVRVLETVRSVGWRVLVTKVDLDEWVEIARHRLAVVEVFSLVDDQSHYTNVCGEN